MRLTRWIVVVCAIAPGALYGGVATSVRLTTTPNPALYGQIVTLSAAVSSASATGEVTFYDGISILGTSAVASGTANLFTIALPSGTRPLRAYYKGDANFSPSESPSMPQTIQTLPGVFGAPVVISGDSGFLQTADFNGDGKADLAISEGSFGFVAVALGNGDGTFQPQIRVGGGCGWPPPVAVADFNGDGKPDIAAGMSCDGSVSIFLGNGDGTFRASSSYATGGNPPFMAVGDFNGDGNPDLALADECYALCNKLATSILLGNGDGTFRFGSNYSLTGSVSIADFNGDGKPDLIAGGGIISASAGATPGSVFLGNGDGTFQAPLQWGPIANSCFAFCGIDVAPTLISTGDFNGDGKADLVLTNSSGNTVAVLLGNGDGTFRPPAMYTIGSNPQAVTISDFNGDGRADLAVGSSNGVRILYGNGDGTFGIGPNYQAAIGANFMTVGAFNGSGLPDLAYAGPNGLSVLLSGSPTPDLAITKSHTGNFTQGQTGATYTIGVSNIGTAATSGIIQVVDALPAGLILAGLSGAGWNCISATVACSRSDALAASGSYPPINVAVNVTLAAPLSVTNTATASGGGETNTSNDVASDVTQINVVANAQIIIFGALSDELLSAPPFQINATASSGLTVSFVSNTSSVCTVSGMTVDLIAVGTCSITATQGGNTKYAVAIPVTQRFGVRASAYAGPVVSGGGIVPAFSSLTTIQPSSWISIYGVNFASTITTWTGNFSTQLGGVTVTVNGKNAYLSLVTPTQINLQAPDDTTTGVVPVTVTNGSGSWTSIVTLGSVSPSFLLLDAKHVAAIIIRSDGSGAYGGGTYDIAGPSGTSLGYRTVAGKAGDSIELYGVGFGPTNPVVHAGQPFSGSASTTNTVQLAIDGIPVTPSFAGLSSAGLYQINLTVPTGLGTGDQLLVATVAGVQTQPGVVISLQ
ncbi:MAG TPA: FG-GAP-like repeat-containing protein [Bryobacteraceae bacterium]|jgi:uncharacterized protein (TIGR03437 family)|nr:FG-GAP-like repeat-containing protein [Bryobacteraceae bacterium]